MIESKGHEWPVTIAQLNGWIHNHFNVLQVSRAYAEFYFPIRVGYEDEQRSTGSTHRVAMLTLGFRGDEEACCKAIAAHLYLQVSREMFLDAAQLLFLRREFTLDKADELCSEDCVRGRLAFWETDKNAKLIASPCFVSQGGLPRLAAMPAGLFERF